MAWCRPGDKALSEPMMDSLLTLFLTSLGLNELTTQRGQAMDILKYIRILGVCVCVCVCVCGGGGGGGLFIHALISRAV